MRRIAALIIFAFALLLSACSNAPADQASDPEQSSDSNQTSDSEQDSVSGASEWVAQEVEAEEIKTSGEGIVVDNVFVYNHVNGQAEETERLAYVLYEFETLKYIKYQVAYLACT